MLDKFIHEARIAYFSMEIVLRNEMPTYAGGLGVLAGDTMRSATDLELPMVAVSLASRAGYFRQQLDAQGYQVEHEAIWDPKRWAQPLDAKIAVPIEGRTVWIGAWLYVLEGHMGGRQPVLLLDTDLDENHGEDRAITRYLYGGDNVYRLKQEIVLGIGGVRMLQALGFIIRHYHMNEGHSALLGLELMRRSIPTLSKRCAPANLPMTSRACATCAALPPTRRSKPDMTVFHTSWCSACSTMTSTFRSSRVWPARIT